MTRFCGALIVLAVLGIMPYGALRAQNLSNFGGGGMLGQGLPNVSSAGTSNTAGVLSYCVKNNYLKGDGAQSATSALSTLTGKSGTQSSDGFTAGQQGNLETGNGGNFSMSGLQDQAKSKVCDMVLQHAQSML